jgi:Flp pilus assembly pilin Flp
MARRWHPLKRFLRDESGASMTEYLIIVGFASFIAITAFYRFGRVLNDDLDAEAERIHGRGLPNAGNLLDDMFDLDGLTPCTPMPTCLVDAPGPPGFGSPGSGSPVAPPGGVTPPGGTTPEAGTPDSGSPGPAPPGVPIGNPPDGTSPGNGSPDSGSPAVGAPGSGTGGTTPGTGAPGTTPDDTPPEQPPPDAPDDPFADK